EEVERQTKLAGTSIYAIKNLALNLAETEFMDSAGLGALVRLLRTLRAAGGGLKLCQLPRKVLQVIEMTNLRDLFPVYASEAEAIQSFATDEGGQDEQPKSSKVRIVCVDPSKDLLAGLYAYLSRAGYE